jgi:hypothetical protein
MSPSTPTGAARSGGEAGPALLDFRPFRAYATACCLYGIGRSSA